MLRRYVYKAAGMDNPARIGIQGLALTSSSNKPKASSKWFYIATEMQQNNLHLLAINTELTENT